MVLHVDDFVYAGTEQWKLDVINVIKETFLISSEFETSFKYIGFNINQQSNVITVDQNAYIQSISEIPLTKERNREKMNYLLKMKRRAFVH